MECGEDERPVLRLIEVVQALETADSRQLHWTHQEGGAQIWQCLLQITQLVAEDS